MELNREQIVKALECCTSEEGCTECPRFLSVWGCSRQNMIDALALIRELTEENEKLRDNLERTEKALIALDKAHNALFTDTFRIEAETVRKMQERLKANAFIFASTDDGRKYFAVEIDTIDQTAKELLEDLNNG